MYGVSRGIKQSKKNQNQNSRATVTIPAELRLPTLSRSTCIHHSFPRGWLWFQDPLHVSRVQNGWPSCAFAEAENGDDRPVDGEVGVVRGDGRGGAEALLLLLLLLPLLPQMEKRDDVEVDVAGVVGEERSSLMLEAVFERPGLPEVDFEMVGDRGDGGMYVYVWFAARKWRHVIRPPSASELGMSGRSLKRGGVGLMAWAPCIKDLPVRPMKAGRVNSRTMTPGDGEGERLGAWAWAWAGANLGSCGPLYAALRMLSTSCFELESEKDEGPGTGTGGMSE